MAILVFNGGMSLQDALALTRPQLDWAVGALMEVRKAEANEPGESKDVEANNAALEATVRALQQRTGRKSFSMEEIADPVGTIRRHEEERT